MTWLAKNQEVAVFCSRVSCSLPIGRCECPGKARSRTELSTIMNQQQLSDWVLGEQSLFALERTGFGGGLGEAHKAYLRGFLQQLRRRQP